MSFSSVAHMVPVPLPPSTTLPPPVDLHAPSARAPFVPQTPSRPTPDDKSVPWGPQRNNRAMARGSRRVTFGPLPGRDDANVLETPSKPSRKPKRPQMKRRNASKPTPLYGGKDGCPVPSARDPFFITSPDEFLAMVAPEPYYPSPGTSEPSYVSDDSMACDSHPQTSLS